MLSFSSALGAPGSMFYVTEVPINIVDCCKGTEVVQTCLLEASSKPHASFLQCTVGRAFGL